MNLFIPIVSCWKHRFTHQAIRDTWLTTCSVPYKFILGEAPHGLEPAADELVLPTGDTYETLTDKAIATLRYALDHDYDYILHVGRDTYVDVPKVLASDLECYDYAGNCGCQDSHGYYCELGPMPAADSPFHYASGGTGSWLSRNAMKLIVDSKIRHEADDLMFGWILGLSGVPLWSDWRFQKKGTSLWSKHQFTLHLGKGTGKYNRVWMYHAHNKRIPD